jgi:hypothetical protein
MKPYIQLQAIYQVATTWEQFLDIISRPPEKWILILALEEGWKAKILNDLYVRYKVDIQEVDTLLNRYESLCITTPYELSNIELITRLNELVGAINVLRGYLRYAYYSALVDEDEVIGTIDELLTQVGSGTPTREECSESYTIITGKHINPDTVVLEANTADSVADILAIHIEELLRRNDKRDTDEINRLNDLHIKLTGRSII